MTVTIRYEHDFNITSAPCVAKAYLPGDERLYPQGHFWMLALGTSFDQARETLLAKIRLAEQLAVIVRPPDETLAVEISVAA